MHRNLRYGILFAMAVAIGLGLLLAGPGGHSRDASERMQANGTGRDLHRVDPAILILRHHTGHDEDPDEGPDTPVEPTCTAYGVQDSDLAGSTIFRWLLLDPETGLPVEAPIVPYPPCGPCDIEALALNPESNVLYGIAGGSSTSPTIPEGELFEVDKETGALNSIDSTGAESPNEIVAASYRESDLTLWAFQEGFGLLIVDVTDASTTPEFDVRGELDQFRDPVGDNWEGIAWDLDSEYLYGTDGGTLYRWDPVERNVDLVCSNLAPPGGEIEALEFTREGVLVGSRHLDEDRLIIAISYPENAADFGPLACPPPDPVEVPGELLADDIESLAFEACLDDEDEDVDDEDVDDEDGDCDEGPDLWGHWATRK